MVAVLFVAVFVGMRNTRNFSGESTSFSGSDFGSGVVDTDAVAPEPKQVTVVTQTDNTLSNGVQTSTANPGDGQEASNALAGNHRLWNSFSMGHPEDPGTVSPGGELYESADELKKRNLVSIRTVRVPSGLPETTLRVTGVGHNVLVARPVAAGRYDLEAEKEDDSNNDFQLFPQNQSKYSGGGVNTNPAPAGASQIELDAAAGSQLRVATSNLSNSPPTNPPSPTTASEPVEPRKAKGPTTKPSSGSAKKTKKREGPKYSSQGSTAFKLAGQPELGAEFFDDTPVTDKRAWLVPTPEHDFSADAIDQSQGYDPESQISVYSDKTLNANQRPLVELGRPWYQLGQLPEPMTFLGEHNPVVPQFTVYGDFRTAVASNTKNGANDTVWAFQWNLNVDLKITATERFVTFINPFGSGGRNTRFLFGDNQFDEEFDADFDFGFFEGDLGAIVGGFTGETLPFDLPFAIGFMPLVVQNGIWFDDAVIGVAATIPARNSSRFDISNMDITFFALYDEINSPAFPGDDDVAKMYGMMSFIDAMNGHFEIDYAFIEDRNRALNRSYHNIGLAFTRRYGRSISNSVRMIVNAGQSTNGGSNTADGVLLLSENSLITAHPSNLVPYFNMFAGFDHPQSAARAGAAGGVLKNTGILFESDNLTGYPTLDASGNNVFGAALGINLLAADFSQQLVMEIAGLGVMKEAANRKAQGDQYGIAFRHQVPLSNNVILRTDGMIGFFRNANDVRGFRVELRHKY